MSTFIKLSQDVTQYYKNIILPRDVKVRAQRDIQVRIVQKMLTSYKKKLESRAEGFKEKDPRWSTADHYITAVQL